MTARQTAINVQVTRARQTAVYETLLGLRNAFQRRHLRSSEGPSCRDFSSRRRAEKFNAVAVLQGYHHQMRIVSPNDVLYAEDDA